MGGLLGGGTTSADRGEIAAIALRWLQSDPVARVLVDDSRNVLWRNPAAERLLLDCPDLDARDGHLSAEDRNQNAALIELVQKAKRDDCTLCIPCLNGDGHLLLHARRIEDGPHQGAVAICLQRTGSKAEIRYADFQRAFGLTGSEYQVARMLINGLTAEDIASRTGNSIGTVRSHIRSIYVKLDVSSREMLFFRLRPFLIL